ncbi:hypothetical protein [Sphingobacterium hungaricum]
MDFTEYLKQFFLNHYSSSLDKSKLFISFEPIGCMLDELDSEDANAKNKALEQLSILAERLPAIHESLIAGTSRLSDLYETMIQGSRFRSSALDETDREEYLKVFSLAKSEAIAKLEKGKRASLATPMGNFFLVQGAPDGWYDKNSGIWTSQKFEMKDSAKNPNPEKPKLKFNLKWKALINQKAIVDIKPFEKMKPIDNVVLKPIFLDKHSIFLEPKKEFKITRKDSKTAVKSDLAKPMSIKNASALNQLLLKDRTMITKDVIKVMPNMSTISRMELIHALDKEKLIKEEPVNSNGMEISFDYCLVNLQRDWIDRSLFVYSKLWYSLAVKKGFFSNGMKDDSNTGEIKSMTVAMILIKNLKVKAQWNQTDKNIGDESLSLGMFNVTGNKMTSSSEIGNEGIQILGWICEVLPQLPEFDDPNI